MSFIVSDEELLNQLNENTKMTEEKKKQLTDILKQVQEDEKFYIENYKKATDVMKEFCDNEKRLMNKFKDVERKNMYKELIKCEDETRRLEILFFLRTLY